MQLRRKLASWVGKLLMIIDGGQVIHASPPLYSNLSLKHFRNNQLITERNLGAGLVCNAGVNLLSADWQNATATLKLANYHDSGTGITVPTIADTIMQTPTGNARIAGAQSNLINVYKTIATLNYAGAFAITEWGLFTALTGPTLWDHRTFTAINCVSGDSIQFSYSLSIISGG